MAAAVAAAIGTDFGANALAPVSNTVTMNRRIDAPSQAVARINRRDLVLRVGISAGA